jgi:hypothetical protein
VRLLFVLWAAAVALDGQNDCSRNTFRFGKTAKSTDQIKQDYGGYVFRFNVHSAIGTGFLIDPSAGYLLTAYHVINGAGSTIEGELESIPNQKFNFSVAADLCQCKNNCNTDAGRCQTLDGTFKGIDAVLLKMDSKDLEKYHSSVGDYSQAFDVLLGPEVPDQVYSIGYPEETNRGKPPFLLPLAPTNVSASPIDYENLSQVPLLLWYLTGAVVPGRSGSPLFDANGRVFGLLIQESRDSHNGIAMNLADIFDRLQSAAPARNPFRSLPLRPPASTLEQKIRANSYQNEGEIAHDLTPPLVSNRELTTVILDVASGGPPPFRFNACLGAAVQQRDLAGLFRYLYPKPDDAPPRVSARYHVQRAQGLYRAGYRKLAQLEFESGYEAAKKDTAPGKDTTVEIIAALGASKILLDEKQLPASKTFARRGLNAANASKSDEFAALADTYLYQIEISSDPSSPEALKFGRSAFIQHATPVYNFIGEPSKQEDLFEHYLKIPALGWQPYVGVVQNDLEPKLLRLH